MKGAVSLTDILDALVAEDGPLDAVTIHLVSDTFTPSAFSTAAELAEHEADFAGYAASAALTWLAPWVDGAGTARVDAESVQFMPTDSVTPNTIYSYWIQKGTGGTAKVAAWYALPSPVPMTSVFDSLIVNAHYSITQ